MTSTSTAPALTLPPISALPTLSAAEMEQLLDLLFEPSPALHSLCLPILHGVTFASYDAIISHINNLLKDLANRDKNTLDEILGSHPRLGAKKVESAQSQAEQRQLNHGAEGEKEELAWLNQQYEHRFPGLRYV
jgi:2-oxo-4-hydroxy-4-carboxy--5-ureidoimidazoline (OHCU) decarboxylase